MKAGRKPRFLRAKKRLKKGLLHSPRKGDQSPLRSIRNRLLLSLPLRTSLCSLGLHLAFAFGECSTGAPLGSGPPRLCLSSLWDSRAAKAQGKNFCSRRASSASQKFILAPHMSLLRIIHGGAAAPPYLPEFFWFSANLCCTTVCDNDFCCKYERLLQFICSSPGTANIKPRQSSVNSGVE